MNDQPDHAELAHKMATDHLGDIVAVLSAMRRNDAVGLGHVVATADPAALIVPLAHLVDAFAVKAVGAEAWEEALTAWKPGQVLGEGLAD